MGYKKKKNDELSEDTSKPTPFELKVATYLHKNLKNIDGKLSGCLVNIFNPQDAIDILLESPWSKLYMKEKYSEIIHFTSEKVAVDFMSQLLKKGLISRALKSKKDFSKRKEAEKKNKRCSKLPEGESDHLMTEKKQNTIEDNEKEAKLDRKLPKNHSKLESKSKTDYSSSYGFFNFSSTKKPIRIEFTDDQIFLLTDFDTVYVWIYEPPPGLKAWLLGTALILGIMFCCFFPIWPWQLRQGAYYLTLVALGLMLLVFFLAILRLSLYLIGLICTLGRFHFWLFPNLFSDCGVVDSFKPFYCIESSKSKDKISDKKGSKMSSRSGKRLKDMSLTDDASLSKESNEGVCLNPVKENIGKQD